MGTTSTVCDTAADIAFLVDGSSPIEEAEFKKVKEFIELSTKALNVGPDASLQSRVSTVVYSTKVKELFAFNTFSKLSDYTAAISAIKQPKLRE